MKLRPYQQEAVNAVYSHLRAKKNNPCVVLPTGTGKSLVIAKLVKDAVSLWNGRVLILAHVKELLEQNADKVRKLCPEIAIGIYSAGLKSHDTDEKVIVAGIQSVYKKACDLGAFDLIIVDEAHLIAPDGEGMYRTFLTEAKVVNPNVRVIGLTATPFRLKGGMICQPENILNEICYEAGLKDMIQQGYLAPLVSKAGKVQANLADLHVRGGEFVNAEVSEVMNKDNVVDEACREIVELTRDRKSVLIFAASIVHCRNVAEKIERYSGMECAIVTGDTPSEERAEIISRFKGEAATGDFFVESPKPLKFLANVGVLTTGFDAPNTDAVVLMRPTNSAGLLIQMVGRGTRLSPGTGKTDCLVLDYGENILRHGPVDMITMDEVAKREGDGIKRMPGKMCPQCNLLIHAACKRCPGCGFEFPLNEFTNVTGRASTECIISDKPCTDEFDVISTYYSVHRKRNAPPNSLSTMRVDYEIAPGEYKSEWVCPEHFGYARRKFEKWWEERIGYGGTIPDNAEDAVEWANRGYLAETKKIQVRNIPGERFSRITKHILGERPVIRNPGEDFEEDFPEPTSNSPRDLGVYEDEIPF